MKHRRWKRVGIFHDITFVETCNPRLWSLSPRHSGAVAEAKLRTHDLRQHSRGKTLAWEAVWTLGLQLTKLSLYHWATHAHLPPHVCSIYMWKLTQFRATVLPEQWIKHRLQFLCFLAGFVSSDWTQRMYMIHKLQFMCFVAVVLCMNVYVLEYDISISK